jgi:hypothetical protein
MSADKTYNGWTNYETWCVSLWIDNDKGMYYTARDMAAGMGERIQDGVSVDDARYDLADQLKDWIDEVAEMTCPGSREGASFVSDLLGAALSEVNWYEIAENKLDDALEGLQVT